MYFYLLITFCTLTLLLIVHVTATVLILFKPQIAVPYLDEDDVFRSIPEITPEEAKDAESQLKINPDNFLLRASYLKSVFGSPDAYKNPNPYETHARWLIENKPEYIATAFTIAPFLGHPDKETVSRQLMNTLLEKEKRSPSSLRTAVIFCTNLNTEFALECAEELFRIESLNPDVLDRMVRLNGFLVYEEKDTPKKWKKTWRLTEQQLSWTWSENDYWKLQLLRSKFGKFLWPYYISYLCLYIKGRIENRTFGFCHHVTQLSSAGMIALNAGENAKAVVIGKHVEKEITDYEKTVKWPPFLFESFYFLARLAIQNGDVAKAKYYLAKRENFPADSEFSLIGDSAAIANILVKIGHKDLAVEHFKNLTRTIPENAAVQKYINILNNGRLLTRETINEK